jgi:dinuclear metal center YbgI/SA1388 family protein
MLPLKELSLYIDQRLSSSNFIDYQPNGLQVEGNLEVKKVALGVSASLETIQEAAMIRADALIVHHGLFWKDDPYPLIGSKKKRIETLISHNISLLAYHLPLDAHESLGNNFGAATLMGFKNLEPFLIKGSPLGVIGETPSLTPEAFKKQLEEFYEHKAVSALFGKKEIKRVGIISGGAHKMIEEAIRLELDAFVTGSFDEPIWHMAKEAGIHFFALGHAATERIGVKLLGEELQRRFALETHFIQDDNPM